MRKNQTAACVRAKLYGLRLLGGGVPPGSRRMSLLTANAQKIASNATKMVAHNVDHSRGITMSCIDCFEAIGYSSSRPTLTGTTRASNVGFPRRCVHTSRDLSEASLRSSENCSVLSDGSVGG